MSSVLPSWLSEVPLGAFDDPCDGLDGWLVRNCPRADLVGFELRDWSFSKRWHDDRQGASGRSAEGQPLAVLSTPEGWLLLSYPSMRASEWVETPAWDRARTLLGGLFDDRPYEVFPDAGALALNLAGEIPHDDAIAVATQVSVAGLALLLRSLDADEADAVRTLVALTHPGVTALVDQRQRFLANAPHLPMLPVMLRESLRSRGSSEQLANLPNGTARVLPVMLLPVEQWPEAVDALVEAALRDFPQGWPPF